MKTKKKRFIYQMKEMTISEEGKGRAVFATLNVKDKDNDITIAGAFGTQLAHAMPMHVWTDGDTPFLGIAKISETDREAVADIELNMELPRAKDWRSSLKFALDRGKTIEWSYGFDVLDSAMETRDGEMVRILKKLTVHEVSPVVIGAGVNTRTTAMKSYVEVADSWEQFQHRLRMRAHETLVGEKDGWVNLEATFADRIVVTACIAPTEANGKYEEKTVAFDWSEGDDGEVVLTNEKPVSLEAVVREKGVRITEQVYRVMTELKLAVRAISGTGDEAKEGRVLSSANRTRLTRMLGSISETAAEIDKLLRETDPDEPKAREEILKLFGQNELRKSRFAGALH